MSKKSAQILWIDLEMTGLSPVDDPILEVAAIATDWDFNEIGTYEGVVKCDLQIINERMAFNSTFWNANPEARESLLSQNDSGKSRTQIESELLKFIDKHFEPNVPVLIAGNSIHNDRRFIIEQWQKLNKKLHYRMLDVSAWKVVFSGKFSRIWASSDKHRAIDDIRRSIDELKYYLSYLK